MSFGLAASSYVDASGPSGDSAYQAAVLADGPLVYLPLNETSGTVAADTSGNGRDATYAGDIIFDQYSLLSGSSGRSVRSDDLQIDNSWISIPHAAWMDTAEITVLLSCMIPPNGISMLAARYASDGVENDNSWFIDVAGGNYIYLYYRTTTNTWVSINSGVVPVEGKRLYIAAYVNAVEAGIRIYEDGGVLLGSATGAGGVINTSAADLTLFRSQAPGYQLRGYMDDFALFGTSLPTSRMDELAALAYAPYTPWLALSEGTAARNGTNDHTITFSPAANDSLLVAIIGGSVTHTMVTAGWTKQLSAVWSTELAVFTKIATSGESSLQVTHNSANYPVEYAVYEFPAGSSYHSGAMLQGGGPFPTLSGLPGQGSKITVFAAQSEYEAQGDLPVATTWDFFWRTSVNRNTPGDGVTVGSFMNVGYFAFNDFPSTTASVTDPTPQYDVLHYEQAVLFAIQHN